MIEINIFQHFEFRCRYLGLLFTIHFFTFTFLYCITQCRGNNNPDGQIWHVTHCFFNFPTMALSQENVLKDYSVHRTGVGILKKIIKIKSVIIVYELGLL